MAINSPSLSCLRGATMRSRRFEPSSRKRKNITLKYSVATVGKLWPVPYPRLPS